MYYIWIISTIYVDVNINCKAYPRNPQKASTPLSILSLQKCVLPEVVPVYMKTALPGVLDYPQP